MASIKRRGKSWRARYRAPDGRERSKQFATKANAEAWLSTHKADVARGQWVDPRLGRMSFGGWVPRWERTTVDLRPTTRALNLGVVRNYLLPRFEFWPLASIATSDVQSMVAEELEEGRLSTSAVRRHVLVLSTILEGAVRDGRLGRNPCRGVKLPPDRTRKMRFLTAEQVAVLADAIGEHYRPLVLTAAYVGLRWGELAGLRLDRVDLLHRRITIDQQALEVGGHIEFGPPKTGAGVRTVTMPAALVEVLVPHFATRAVRESGLAFPARPAR